MGTVDSGSNSARVWAETGAAIARMASTMVVEVGRTGILFLQAAWVAGTYPPCKRRMTPATGGALPSAGRGYATVELGPCNAFWTGMFGPAHVNGPWAPGLDFALFSESFPRSGFVMELDVYLDPDWTANSLEPGTLNFFAPPDAIFTLAASVRELASAPPTPVFHYFAVPVMPDDCALSILGRSVTEEGWYTFRYVFRDEGGRLAVDFELRERRGGKMFTQPLGTRFLSGLPTSDLATADIGSGYLWFAGLTPDLELPIDEHRIRPGR